MSKEGLPELHRARTEWLRGEGDASDVVLSSRVRLARNLAGVPFVNAANKGDRLLVLESCRDRILEAGLASETLWADLRDANKLDLSLLVERSLISHALAYGSKRRGTQSSEDPRGVAVSLPDERASIMVNEEDHIRLQVMRSGFALESAREAADQLDDALEAKLDFAFSPRFGYLTACPTNVGTGARFSVMLHLPGLNLTGEIDKVKRAADAMSLAVRGFFGEGSKALGDFYQVSNQTTLGKSETVLMHEISREVVPQVVAFERDARGLLLAERRRYLEDRVHRALGVLRHARLLGRDEAMELLSFVRLGVVLELFGDDSPALDAVHHLMLLVHAAHLQRAVGRVMEQDERSAARAALVRARLAVDG
ncbi:MAG: ATP--guanido phosphotransferase [Planctomycetota bacterium]